MVNIFNNKVFFFNLHPQIFFSIEFLESMERREGEEEGERDGEEEGEGEKEGRETHQWVASHTCSNWGQDQN